MTQSHQVIGYLVSCILYLVSRISYRVSQISQSLSMAHSEKEPHNFRCGVCVRITYLPGQSPAKYCRRK